MKDSHSQKAATGFNAATGTSSSGYSRGTSKYSGNANQHGNPDGLINKGRGPVVGNKGTLNSGPKTPPTSAVPGLPAQGSIRDNINRGAQVRTPGGTIAMPATGKTSFDCARGPTKGNQQ